jgi:hypothetical protein
MSCGVLWSRLKKAEVKVKELEGARVFLTRYHSFLTGGSDSAMNLASFTCPSFV